jgi:hypothetical protein
MTRAELLALADRLDDYTVWFSMVVCDRHTVDEAVAALRALAEGMNDDQG